MSISISTTLFGSLPQLSQIDSKRVTGFLVKFMEDATQRGISLERITQTRCKDLWSARITQELRAILQKEGEHWSILYAGHHDDAYAWAARKRVERHPVSGALQFIETTEAIDNELQSRPMNSPGLFDAHKDDYLLSLGVPQSWLPTIKKIDSEVLLFKVIDLLPEEVAERLISLAEGEFVTPPIPVTANMPAAESPDTQRRFYVLEDSKELIRLLEAPLSQWIVFLHPSQKKLATSNYSGPVKITGSAGTGKTVVAMHRAQFLARKGKRVLLTSFVKTLCDNLEYNLKFLCSQDELTRISVDTIHAQALAVIGRAGENIRPITDDELNKLFEQFYFSGCPLDKYSLRSEWDNVIQANGIRSWDGYRDISRKGRGRSLSTKDRKLVWCVFSDVFNKLSATGSSDWASLCLRARQLIQAGSPCTKYDAVIVDEAQDLRPQELMFLSSLRQDEKDSLMLVGDGGQRIYPGKLSLRALGIDVRGRSHILKINYRTTEQIREFADRLLESCSDDLDDGKENRAKTRSLLKGPVPQSFSFSVAAEQSSFIATKIAELVNGNSGLAANDIAVFARRSDLLEPIEKAITARGIPTRKLKKELGSSSAGGVNLGTMHRAKGLEFKVVFVVDASNGNLPSSQALKMLSDPQDIEDFIERERQLLYVSITRARDEAFISWVGKPSRFLTPVLSQKTGSLT